MTDQPLIVAVSEPWGLYCNAITADPEAITRCSMTLNQARDFVRRSPRAEGQPPAVIASFTELGRRLVAAGVTEPQPLALYRLISRKGQTSVGGRPRGRWHQFTFTPSIR